MLIKNNQITLKNTTVEMDHPEQLDKDKNSKKNNLNDHQFKTWFS